MKLLNDFKLRSLVIRPEFLVGAKLTLFILKVLEVRPVKDICVDSLDTDDGYIALEAPSKLGSMFQTTAEKELVLELFYNFIKNPRIQIEFGLNFSS